MLNELVHHGQWMDKELINHGSTAVDDALSWLMMGVNDDQPNHQPSATFLLERISLVQARTLCFKRLLKIDAKKGLTKKLENHPCVECRVMVYRGMPTQLESAWPTGTTRTLLGMARLHSLTGIGQPGNQLLSMRESTTSHPRNSSCWDRPKHP